MGKIIDLPVLERPREKALRYGIDTLSDGELISLILSKGVPGENVNDLSNRLLSDYKGLFSLKDVTLEELTSYKGIKSNKAITLLAVFAIYRRLMFKEAEQKEVELTPEYFYEKYRYQIGVDQQERLVLIVLNYSKKIIYETVLYKGTANDVIFAYKDIWNILALRRGKFYYIIHNHPLAPCTPSPKDRMLTSELALQSKRNGTPMLDHIIIGEDGYFSFQENKKF